MNFIDKAMVMWKQFSERVRPVLSKTHLVLSKTGKTLSSAWNYILKFRKIFLAAPVGTMAVILALQNMVKLPAVVGLDLQLSGEFNIQIAREIAALGPMAITALCLLLMFCSKRTLTPWIVSVISLLLPLLILVTNTFPA